MFWERFGVGVVMWIYAGLYVLSAVLTLCLKLPIEEAVETP
jgi:hypothetical protein